MYRKPAWNLLEGAFAFAPVNPHHTKAVPGRKTDIADAEWIADPLRRGLLRGSYVPDRPRREPGESTRPRASLARGRTAEGNRLQKTPEGANSKPATVATDVLGKSGRGILRALVAGAEDAAELAQPARGRPREKLPELRRAPVGRFAPYRRFLPAEHLAQIDSLDGAIARVGAAIAERLRLCEEALDQLDTVPGVVRYVAEAPLAAIGTNMGRFPTAAQPAS